MSDSTRDINVALINAAKRGDTNEVKRLISEGADVNAYDGFQGNSLYWAVENDRSDIAKVLLDNGADFIVYDSSRKRHVQDKFKSIEAEYCKRSLHLAAKLGNLEAVKDLLGKGTDVNAQNDTGETPLHVAAIHGHKDVVEALLEVEGIDVNAQDKYNSTPLHRAAEMGYKDVVEALLDKGANVNAEDDKGETPLHVAAIHGHKDVVEALLDKGANVDAEDENGDTLLNLATTKDIRTLLQNTAELLEAARRGDIDEVKRLIDEGDEGASVNATDQYGKTPLHSAAIKGHEEVVEALLKVNGINVNAVDKDGKTPLHCAVVKGHQEIVEALLEVEGIDVNADDNNEQTPLHSVLKENNIDINVLNALLRKEGIDVNLADKNKDTPLHSVLKKGNIDINVLNALLRKEGIDVNAVDVHNNTPLHLAVKKDNIDINVLNALLGTKGIDVNIKDKYGEWTPLHWAVSKNRIDKVKALLGAEGIDVNIEGKNGNTPFKLATDEGIKTLLQNAEKTDPVDESSTDSEGVQEEDAGALGEPSIPTQNHGGQTSNTSAEQGTGVQDKGVNPVAPTEPAQPVAPIEPAQPVAPTEPAQPVAPTEPAQPVAPTEPAQPVAPTEPAQTEEQPSSFFGSLFSILMKPFSLIGSFLGGFFSWLFCSDEPTQSPPESDQQVVLEPPNNPGDNDII